MVDGKAETCIQLATRAKYKYPYTPTSTEENKAHVGYPRCCDISVGWSHGFRSTQLPHNRRLIGRQFNGFCFKQCTFPALLRNKKKKKKADKIRYCNDISLILQIKKK